MAPQWPQGQHTSHWVGAAIAVAAGILLAVEFPAAHARTTKVTWTADISSIVQARCAQCHQAGGFGLVALGTYAEAKAAAPRIRDEVLAGRMPPWPAVRGFGDYRNDASLSPVEAELITRWVEGGAPLGATPPSAPARAERPPAHGIRFDLPAFTVSGEWNHTFTIQTSFPDARWITGWEVRPGDRSLVQKATLAVNGVVADAWTPFDSHVDFSSGTGERLPAGSRLSLTMTYQKTSEPATDRTTLILFVADSIARERQHRTLDCGTSDVPRDMDLLSVRPQASSAGDSVQVVAYRPDGSVDPLCVIARFQPQFALTYRLRHPEFLEHATKLDVRSTSPNCTAVIDYVAAR